MNFEPPKLTNFEPTKRFVAKKIIKGLLLKRIWAKYRAFQNFSLKRRKYKNGVGK